MSASRLSEKSVRRIERSTGLDVARAWSHGGYWLSFVVITPSGHEHGEWHRRSGEVHYPLTEPWHYNTCRELDALGRYEESA
jgi:hypothetical protein